MIIRPERPEDIAAVRAVNQAAFPAPAEAALVDRLRGLPGVISLVADDGSEVIGHILFSPVTVEHASGDWTAIALGPMAVRPDRQRSGVGGALVEAGLTACRQGFWTVCFVLGHPEFYPRFGFAPAAPLGLRCTWTVPDPVFMVAEVTPGTLTARSGLVRYHPAFDDV